MYPAGMASLPCRAAALALVVALAPACTDDAGAEALFDQLQSDDFRNAYGRAPGWEEPRAPRAGGPHGSFVDIYINQVMVDAIQDAIPLTAWPEGSIVVKEGWATADAVDAEFLVAMKRGRDGWFWAEWRGDGSLVVAGDDAPACVKCHDTGEDQVRAFPLPPL